MLLKYSDILEAFNRPILSNSVLIKFNPEYMQILDVGQTCDAFMWGRHVMSCGTDMWCFLWRIIESLSVWLGCVAGGGFVWFTPTNPLAFFKTLHRAHPLPRYKELHHRKSTRTQLQLHKSIFSFHWINI